MSKTYKFGRFTLNTSKQTLYDGTVTSDLPTKLFETLRLLVENNGKVLSKDEMISTIWQDTFVEESNLAQYISRLRKLLNVDGQQYIRTFSKLGYRFTADLEIMEDSAVTRQIRLSLNNTNNSNKINSLAIIPFRGFAVEKEFEFLGLGIADALITQLTNTRKILVRPTNSVLKYAQTEKSLGEIAEELEVESVLSGNFQKIENRIRLSAQLSSKEKTLWAATFNFEAVDIFSVQDEIAEKVTRSLLEEISPELNLKKRYTENVEAYQEYLKGRIFHTKRDGESLRKALFHFEKAIEIDPLYALAYAGIADIYDLMPAIDELPPQVAFPKAKAAALRALEIDANLAEAHTSLGIIILSCDWNWQGAELSFLRAIELNPNNARSYHVYATFLLRLQRYAEALIQLKKAQVLDPISPVINTWLGECLNLLDENEAAISLHQNTINFFPEYFPAYYHLVLLYLKVKRLDDAKNLAEKALKVSMDSSLIQFAFASFYAAVGNIGKVRDVLNEMLENRITKYVSATNIASCHAILGENEKALDWLETAANERDTFFTWINIDSEFKDLKKERRFKKLVNELFG